MSGAGRDERDVAMEQSMGALLIAGVMLASVVVLVGGVLYLVAAHGVVPQYGVFHGEPMRFREPGRLLRGVLRGDAASVIQVGVLLLIATPVARVVFAAVSFGRERDWLYVGVSVGVLVVLLVGMLGRV